MNNLKYNGDIGELVVVSDLAKKGYRLALPYGDNWDYDILLCRNGNFEKIQVKYTESDGQVISVRTRTMSRTGGKQISSKKYTAAMVDWMAVYDKTTDCCYYIPASELGEGKAELSLRLTPTSNNQVAKIRWARDYLEI